MTHIEKLIAARDALRELAGTPDVLGLHGYVEGVGHAPILPGAMEGLERSINQARAADRSVPMPTALDKAKDFVRRVKEAVTALNAVADEARNGGVEVTFDTAHTESFGARRSIVTTACSFPL